MCKQRSLLFILVLLLFNYSLLRGKFCVSAASLRDSDDLFIWGAVEKDNEATQRYTNIDSRFGEVTNNNAEKDVNTTVIEVFNHCICVIYYQCDDDNFIIKDGSGIIEERSNFNTERIQCPKEGYVCCKKREDGGATEADPEVRHPVSVTSTSEKPELSTIPSRLKYNCGQQRPTFNVRIFATDEEYTAAIDGEFPWMAAIYKYTQDGYVFKCGGSLIHERVVMTAMHCIKGIKGEDLKVIVNGEDELKEIGEDERFERNVEEVIKHPDYYGGAAHNDMALLILDQSYNTSVALINSVCLPDLTDNFDGTRCIVAGWGKERDKNTGNKNLRKVEVPMIEKLKCERMLRQTKLGSYFELHSSFVCAGGEEGKDACQGDGGGPLVCPIDNKNRYAQVGIVSWGIGCAQKDVPGVYTNVAKFREWIEDELSKRNIYFDDEGLK